jgi:hypothetical protein
MFSIHFKIFYKYKLFSHRKFINICVTFLTLIILCQSWYFVLLIRSDPKLSREWSYKWNTNISWGPWGWQGEQSCPTRILRPFRHCSSYLKSYFCADRSPCLPVHNLSAYCSRAGCPASSVATVAVLQAGTTGAVGAGDTSQWHKLYGGGQTWYL